MPNGAQAGQDTVLHQPLGLLISCRKTALRHANFAHHAVVRTTRDTETVAADGKVTAAPIRGSGPVAQQHATHVNAAMKEQTLEEIEVVTNGPQRGIVAADTRISCG